MANLADIFFGSFERSIGQRDRQRQVNAQIQAQEMAGAEFNNQQYDRNMAEFARRTTTAILDLKDRFHQQGKDINEADIGIEDFVDVYGKEEAIKRLNHIGFGAGSLGENKFIADITFNDDGTITPTVGVYDKDEEGNPYVYSERFTKGGKKAAEGGEYEDLDLKGANATLQRYLQGVRGAGGMFPQVAYMERTQKGAFGFGDREGAEKIGQDAVDNIDGTPPVADNQAGENTGFGVTYTDPNMSGQTDADPTAPPLENIPMGNKLYDQLPKMEAGDPQVGPMEGLTGGETEFLSEESLKAAGIGPDYIEHNLNLPFNMTQEQFDSLEDWQQQSVLNAAKRLNYRNIKARAKKILKPEGSSAVIGGGVFSDVRSDALNYKDGKKQSRAGLNAQERRDIDNANEFYHNNEGEIYSYLQNNPRAFEEFEKDPQAFATNPKYTQNGKLITPAPAKVVAQNKVALKTVAKNIDAGTPTDQDNQTVATVLSQNMNPETQLVNMRQYGRNDRISISKTILASVPPQQQALYMKMLGVFEETGMMTLDAQSLGIQQGHLALQQQYASDASDDARNNVQDYINTLTRIKPDGTPVAFDDDDLPQLAQNMAAHITTSKNAADVHLYSQPIGLMMQKYINKATEEGFINTIKSWFIGKSNDGGMRITPNIRLFTWDGKQTTDPEALENGGWIANVGEDGTQTGGKITLGEMQAEMDEAAVQTLIGFAQMSGTHNVRY